MHQPRGSCTIRSFKWLISARDVLFFFSSCGCFEISLCWNLLQHPAIGVIATPHGGKWSPISSPFALSQLVNQSIFICSNMLENFAEGVTKWQVSQNAGVI